MKIKLILTLFLFNTLTSCSQNKNEKLMYKIKSYSEVIYKAEKQNGKIEKTKKNDEEKVYVYNEKGDLTQYDLYFNHKGKRMKTTESYFYDDKGNLIRTKKMNGQDLNIYNNKNLLIEKSEQYSSGRFKSKYIYQYDKVGNNTECNSYAENGSLKSKVICKYDKEGNKIKVSFFGENNSLVNRSLRKYSKTKNLVESSLYNSNNELRSKSIYKYDNKGNEIENSHYNSNKELTSKGTYKYDKKGNKIKEVEYYNDENKLVEDEVITRKYDKKGNEIEYTKRDSYGTTIFRSKKYIYNEKGDWIKLIIDINNSIFSITEREYTYY